MPRIAIYPGTFDPVTLGHEDIVRRGADLFDELTVAVGINPEKSPMFTPEERLALLRDVFADLPNVKVASFHGLTVDYARSIGATVMLRGLRTVSDMDAEFTMALANHVLAPDIETVFLMAAERYSHISSTHIRQIATLAKSTGRDHLSRFVPAAVIEPLIKKATS
ncbi:MAG TPA: pantetheine-phosphate adenylyltransferase [Caulifigura sp.]|jgi:pantetheine-phosphate adenylyltransferase|nr:pantetheine-phosphate adenylyltransferase [Caulifigura sp.]